MSSLLQTSVVLSSGKMITYVYIYIYIVNQDFYVTKFLKLRKLPCMLRIENYLEEGISRFIEHGICTLRRVKCYLE